MVQGNHHSPNSFNFTKTLRSALIGSYEERESSGSLRQSYVGVLPFSTDYTGLGVVPDFANVYNDALGQMNDQVRAPIDWTTNAAQASQSASMVQSALKTLAHVRRSVSKLDLWACYLAYQRMRRDPHRSFQRAVREAGNRWLEFQYGWKPLAQDCYNTAVEMGRDFPSLMVCEARAVKVQRSVQSTNLNGIPRTNIQDLSRRVQMKARFRPNTSTAGLLSNFTTLNPATVAWELTPYSFVVDWFVDVGGYMRNLETSLLAQSGFIDGFITESERTEVHSDFSGTFRNSSSGVRATGSGKGSNYFSSLKRTRLTQWPLPRVPTFKADLGSTRLLNAAALIAKEMRVKR